MLAAAGVRAALAVADAGTPRTCSPASPTPTGARTPPWSPTPTPRSPPRSSTAGSIPADLDPPDRVRALDGSVADVADAVVLDTPELVAVLPAGEVVVGGDPRALADLLDLPTASEIVDGEVADAGRPVPWGALPEVVVTCHTLGVPVPDGELWCHDELWVVLRRPAPGRHRVPTWRAADGRRHADDPVRALLAVLGAG